MKSNIRFDIYAFIHKALRARLADALVAIGRMDAMDEEDSAAALAQLRSTLAMCASHIEHENEFLHRALEGRRPGATWRIAQEHDGHRREIAALQAQIARLEAAHGAARSDAAHELYRALALFVAANLAHMHVEETETNQSLWGAFTDAELSAIRDALVASIPPPQLADELVWMVPNIAPDERALMLGEMRRTAPAEFFSRVLDHVRPLLPARDWDKLMNALAPVPAAA